MPRHRPVAGVLRVAIVASMCALLQGCAANTAPSSYTPDSGKALVLFAIGVAPETCWSLISLSSTWVPVNPATREVGSIGFGGGVRCDGGETQAFKDSLSPERRDCYCKVPQWHARAVPPGHYLLDFVQAYVGANRLQTTRFGTRSILDAKLEHDNVLNFYAAPGKITYIGNFTYKGGTFPIRLSRYVLDVEGARDYLRSVPAIKGPLEPIKVSTKLVDGSP